eukprot:gene25920-11596_t
MKKGNMYNTNPVLNKWEEDNHMRHMRKRLENVKSTISTGAHSSPSKKPASGRDKKTSNSKPPGHEGVIAELDELIYARLGDFLADPIIKGVQKYVRSNGQGITNQAQGSTGPSQPRNPNSRPPNSRGKALTSGKKPNGSARPARRPTWDENWSAPNTLANEPRSSSGTPSLPKGAPARAVLKTSPAAAPLVPSGVRGFSPSRPSSSGASSKDDSHPSRVRLMLPPSPSPPADVMTGRAASALSTGRRYRSSNGNEVAALACSHVAAIEVLNSISNSSSRCTAPEAVNAAGHRNLSSPSDSNSNSRSRGDAPAGVNAASHRKLSSPSENAAGHRKLYSPSDSKFDGVSLTHLASSSTPHGDRGRPPLPQSLRRFSATGSECSSATNTHSATNTPKATRPSSAALNRQSSLPSATAHALRGVDGVGMVDDDSYAEEFEEYGSADEDGGERAGQDGRPERQSQLDLRANNVANLRQSVVILNELVQLKIQAICQAGGVQQMHDGDGDDMVITQSDGEDCADDSAEPGLLSTLPAMLSTLPGLSSAHPGLSSTNKLVGYSQELRQSQMLQDGLHDSDLEYLRGVESCAPAWTGDQLGDEDYEDDFEEIPTLEAGEPAGKGGHWGDRQAFGTDTGADSGKAANEAVIKLRDAKARSEEPSHGADMRRSITAHTVLSIADAAKLAGHAAHTLSVTEADDLAKQTEALFGSLMKLNSLMNGPRGKEFSPKTQADDLAKQTEALFGSLMKLNSLMNGPRGKEFSPKTQKPLQIGIGFLPPSGSMTPGSQASSSLFSARSEASTLPSATNTPGSRSHPFPTGLVVDTADAGSGQDDSNRSDPHTMGKLVLCGNDADWMTTLMETMRLSLRPNEG